MRSLGVVLHCSAIVVPDLLRGCKEVVKAEGCLVFGTGDAYSITCPLVGLAKNGPRNNALTSPMPY